jgi:hypothetical protein
MTNFVGPVYELFCRKPKICNGFCKTNFEPEPNNQLSDSYHKLVIRHPQVHKPPSWLQYRFMRAGARKRMEYAGYELDLKNYGTFKSHTIRQRNFGVITKSKGGGMLSTLIVEDGSAHHRGLKKFT